jgi:hypothetical protein
MAKLKKLDANNRAQVDDIMKEDEEAKEEIQPNMFGNITDQIEKTEQDDLKKRRIRELNDRLEQQKREQARM